MAKSGQEKSIEECDENIRIHYRVVKKNGQEPHHHHYEMLDKSLDRRLELSARKAKRTVC